jgi:hypothetical protein
MSYQNAADLRRVDYLIATNAIQDRVIEYLVEQGITPEVAEECTLAWADKHDVIRLLDAVKAAEKAAS